jgi:hypothetical protein
LVEALLDDFEPGVCQPRQRLFVPGIVVISGGVPLDYLTADDR